MNATASARVPVSNKTNDDASARPESTLTRLRADDGPEDMNKDRLVDPRDLYDNWQKLMPDADDDFAKVFTGFHDLVSAPAGVGTFDIVAQAAQKLLVDALERAGKLTKLEVTAVARDPKKAIIYFYGKDGRVIGYSPAQVDAGNVGAFGFNFNFRGGFGFFMVKQTIGLVLPNGNCLLLTADA